MEITSQWWRRRSRIAVARNSSPKTWPHLLKVLSEVRMIEPSRRFRDHPEDHIRLSPCEGLVADLVHHEDAGPQVGAELVRQPSGGLGGFEVEDHVVEAGEVDRVAGPAGCRTADARAGEGP